MRREDRNDALGDLSAGFIKQSPIQDYFVSGSKSGDTASPSTFTAKKSAGR